MSAWSYDCALCGKSHPETHTDYCSSCGGPVLGRRSGALVGRSPHGPGLWGYSRDLSLPAHSEWLSLGEGNTPVVESSRLGKSAGVRRVVLKLEHLSPTGSFKDRAVAAGIAHAVAEGTVAVVCASSGNAAAATAAYAARAGLPSVILVPEGTPVGKLAAACAYGSIAFTVPGDYSEAFTLGQVLARTFGITNLTTTYVNPHAAAALRTLAYELAEQVPEGIDWITVPTGAGPLLYEVAAGFADLVEAGRWPRIPRMVAVQPLGCCPIVKAWKSGRTEVVAWPRVWTGVSGINDPLRGYPGDGTVTLRTVRETAGAAIGLSDADISSAGDDLAHHDGIFVEDAAAASVAAVRGLAEEGRLAENDTVVCLLTGSGLKSLASPSGQPTSIADLASAADALQALGLSLEPRTAG